MSQPGVAITLLKLASLSGAARELAESAGTAVRLTARGAKKSLELAGDIGEAAARGLEVDPNLGRRVAQAGTIGAGIYGAKRGKDKVEQFRYMHNFPPGGY